VLFRQVVEHVGDRPVFSAPLEPFAGGPAGGQAILYDGAGEDWVLVIAGGLPPGGEPYTAVLPSLERPVRVASLERSGPGRHSGYRVFRRDLSSYREIVVTDAAGDPVLRGGFRPYSP
ncbi:MAG: hypothetical protein M3245_06230, partial [Actinomycetota bacterium]|nr:hypothetical protein [Actinomycetota bacterium]